MKMKLTRITGIYTLLGEDDKMIASDDVDMQKDYQIGKLSKQNCDEIFGVVDVEKLAMGYDLYEKINFVGQTRAYKAGFNKAMELNKDKVFTLEDMKEAYGRGFLQHGIKSFNSLIQSLQQPTEIEVEIEMESEYIRMGGVKGVKGSSTKLSNPAYGCKKTDENGCLILKKI
jgi:hypothetical protein